MLGALPSAFYRALDKAVFAEGRTRQSSNLGGDHVYRAHDTWHRETLGKECFAECQTLGEPRRSVKGHQHPSIADSRYVCRVPSLDTRQSIFFFIFTTKLLMGCSYTM